MVHLKFIMFFKCFPIPPDLLLSRPAAVYFQFHVSRIHNIFGGKKYILALRKPFQVLSGAGGNPRNAEKNQTFFIISKYLSAWSFSREEN